jgi:hypothetical protein
MIEKIALSPLKQTSPQSFHIVSGKNDRMAGGQVVRDNASFSEIFAVSDVIDAVNPLQHIPVVNNFYQSLTGDSIGVISSIIGGALFGGPIGAVTAFATTAYKLAHQQNDSVKTEITNQEQLVPDITVADRRSGFTPYNT